MALFENCVGYGLLADRPAAGAPGALYFTSDTGEGFRDNGTGWDQIVMAGGLWESIYSALLPAAGGTDVDAKVTLGSWIALVVSKRLTDGGVWSATTAQHTVSSGKVLVISDVRVGAQVVTYWSEVEMRLHDTTADELLAGFDTYSSYGFAYGLNGMGQAVVPTVAAGHTVVVEANNASGGDRLFSGVWIAREIDT